MENNNEKNQKINELSKFVHDIQETTQGDELFDVPFMIKYQLSDEISTAYDLNDDNVLEGISNNFA